MPTEDYPAAARRCCRDGRVLLEKGRYPNATHLFGLAAECALKTAMRSLPGPNRNLPSTHLPELIDGAHRWLQGRRFNGLRQLLEKADFMEGWEIDSRYWPDEAFTEEGCRFYFDHARRTLRAVELEDPC